MANRHLARSIAMQSLYEWDFWGKDEKRLNEVVEKNIAEFGVGLEASDFIWRLVRGVVGNLTKLDKIIEKSAPEWPLDQITIVDRNILRLGLFELLLGDRKEVPPKVAINEAIRIAQKFSTAESGAFVNGILDRVMARSRPAAAAEGKKK